MQVQPDSKDDVYADAIDDEDEDDEENEEALMTEAHSLDGQVRCWNKTVGIFLFL